MRHSVLMMLMTELKYMISKKVHYTHDVAWLLCLYKVLDVHECVLLYCVVRALRCFVSTCRVPMFFISIAVAGSIHLEFSHMPLFKNDIDTDQRMKIGQHI